jgi:HK97 gp10 family phage protein
MKVTGLKALETQLLSLGTAMAHKTLVAAARKAFMPVIEAAKGMVQTDSSALRDAIKLVVKKPKDGAAVVVVGLKIAGAKRNSRKYFERRNAGLEAVMNPRFRWHFIEFGTAHSSAHPYIRPAFDQNVAPMLATLKEELVKSLTKAIKRKARADAKKAAVAAKAAAPFGDWSPARFAE